MKIRHAKVTDVKKMHKLVEFYADNKEMLHRSLNAIYENIQEYMVAEENGTIVGCGALHVSWDDLAEIKALAVAKTHMGKGIGRKLVTELEKNAVKLDIFTTFALSFKPEFFQKIGYDIISKEVLPQKIWSECINCHLFPDCGEVPLIKDLKHSKKKKK
ncbi:MAG: N-acetyltransferase [Endomicrobiaceae bacterium]|nr:N-acetyltransferase [Endomicrobiaceae bacterium]MDD3053513.1 N-acetyltransferase [Endomicrobiaceae bacterium]MDD3922475.1 N-acetyltransferase [Endomicrobiaceae bacterium]MDD5102347.1 N-acetyltransferase [Endomicrobiaceae bacterium]